ncbi:MAG: hypothetical protein AB7U34_07035 [Novosphingobium sp.]
MGIVTFPPVPTMPAVVRILARYDRPKLEAFLAIAIDLLDTMDGDPDIEQEEDEDDDPLEQDEPTEEDNEDCCTAGDDGLHHQLYMRPCGPLIEYGKPVQFS